MHDIRYDALHDELLVTNPFAQAILVFRGGADGEEAPIRIIQGSRTQLGGSRYAGLDRLDVDPVHDEIYVPNGDSILVFPREGNGNVAPIRVIKGPDTRLLGTHALAVDPVNDVIVVGDSIGQTQSPYRGNLLMYNRTDSGNVKPRAEIAGDNTRIVRINQIQVYPPNGWIVATQPGGRGVEPEGIFVGVWNIEDNGNVPARWIIGGPKSTLKKPRGVALNPRNKELIVADMRLNSVLTYYFPELF